MSLTNAFEKLIQEEVEKRLAAHESDEGNKVTQDAIRAEVERFITALEKSFDDQIEAFKSAFAALMGSKKRRNSAGTASAASAPTDTDALVLSALSDGEKNFKELGDLLYPDQPFQGGRQRGVKNALTRLIAAGTVIATTGESWVLADGASAAVENSETPSEGIEASTDADAPAEEVVEEAEEEVLTLTLTE